MGDSRTAQPRPRGRRQRQPHLHGTQRITTRVVAASGRAADVVVRAPFGLHRVWALLKAPPVALTAPVTWAALLLPAKLLTRSAHRRAAAIPQRISEPHPPHQGRDSIAVLSSARNYFISSDLHRTPPGRRDWSHEQGNAEIYAAVLDYYADLEWDLIENGDVEDFWMVGGSPWGVVYDAYRLLGTVLGPLGRTVRRAAYGEHLRRIIANHAPIYDRIANRFHLEGRYHRIVGNHDDVYYDTTVAEDLRLHFPGLSITDYIVLGSMAEPAALIAHGHISDPWNSRNGAWRGRTVTWVASLVADLPWGQEMGPPTEEEAFSPFRGGSTNVLTWLDHWMGLDHSRQTLDEAELHRAFVRKWGDGRGPWLICGHTHIPLDAPLDPSDVSYFARYMNGGSGVAPHTITGIEWNADEGRPRLVGFTFGHPLPGRGDVVAEVGGQLLVRTDLGVVDGDRVGPVPSPRDHLSRGATA